LAQKYLLSLRQRIILVRKLYIIFIKFEVISKNYYYFFFLKKKATQLNLYLLIKDDDIDINFESNKDISKNIDKSSNYIIYLKFNFTASSNPNLLVNITTSDFKSPLELGIKEYKFFTEKTVFVPYQIHKGGSWELNLGQFYILTFDPVITNDEMKLNHRVSQIPIESNKIQFEISPPSNPNNVKFEKLKRYDSKYICLKNFLNLFNNSYQLNFISYRFII